MDFSSFFSSSGGSGKAGGAGYSSDVQDSGKNTATTSVIVGGIGTQSAGASLGNTGGLGGSFAQQLVIGIAAALAVGFILRK